MTDRDPIQALWKSQAYPVQAMSLADIQSRAKRFQKTVRIRNAMEYGAALFLVIVFGKTFLDTDVMMMKIGALLIVIATVFVCYKLHTTAQSTIPSNIDNSVSALEFHRRELRRQHDAVASVWLWYLFPFVPGMVLFVLGSNASASSSYVDLSTLLASSGSLAIMALVFSVIHWLNIREANRIKQELADMDVWEQLNELH